VNRQQNFETRLRCTEEACKTVWSYFSELSRQLNVIEPDAVRLGLDHTSLWPDMKQAQFRFDARKKFFRDQEVFDYLALGWQLIPRSGKTVTERVRVNFPPDLERVQRRLQAGHVAHERLEQRHPDSNALQAFVFKYDRAAKASVMVTADHDKAVLGFRLACVGGMDIVSKNIPVSEVDPSLLDELARMIVGQPSRFL